MAKKKNISKPVYTPEERIQRVWEVERIKDLMSRRSFYIANDDRRGELNDFWVAEPEHRTTASLGSNWGYYVGMDSISNYYVVRHGERMKAALEEYCRANPGVENNEQNLGYGCMISRPLNTPLVVLSGDGQTAKGIWYSIGQESIARGGREADCRWFNGKIAADFVKENGEWKIWHLVDSNDFSVAPGGSVNNIPTRLAPEDNAAAIEFGKGDIEMLTHNGMLNWSDDYPFLPQEYFRFTDEISYGPEGHPDYED